MTPLLELHGLEVVHRGSGAGGPDGIRAVAGVDLTVGRGEAIGLVGESGCGKSSLARAAVRLVEPTGGRVVFDGRDITHVPEHELRDVRRRLRIVFQNPYGSLNPRRTVREVVARPLVIHGRAADATDVVDAMLERVGLDPLLGDRRPAELSGGQRQRVAIARALVLEPDLVVLDEPVSSLDAEIRWRILQLLGELRDSLGLAYLFIGHDLGDIRRVADRIVVMHLGTVVERGTREDVLTAPRHPYTRALLSAVPAASPDPARRQQRIVLEGELPDPADPPMGCGFRTRCWLATDDCLVRPVLHAEGERDVACHHPDGAEVTH